MSIVPAVPSLRPLFALNLLLALLSAIGLLLPIRLAITLRGVMASDGPTTIMTAPNDAIVSRLPREGQRYNDGAVLFQFQQPLFHEDTEARRRELSDIRQRLNQSRLECSRRIKAAEQRLDEVKKIDSLNAEAYEKQLISRLQMFQYRNAVNTASRDLDEVRSSCRQEQAQLHSDDLAAQTRLRREQVSQQFLSTITATDNGSVYAINVKLGQRVRTGDILARFVRSNQSIASLRIMSADRPFVRVGRSFDVTSPTYSFLPNPPAYRCLVDTITPDLIPSANTSVDKSLEGSDPSSYLLRCRFAEPVDQGTTPLLIGMDITAKAAGNDVTLFQLLLKGYRSAMRQSS